MPVLSVEAKRAHARKLRTGIDVSAGIAHYRVVRAVLQMDGHRRVRPVFAQCRIAYHFTSFAVLQADALHGPCAVFFKDKVIIPDIDIAAVGQGDAAAVIVEKKPVVMYVDLAPRGQPLYAHCRYTMHGKPIIHDIHFE